MNKWKILCIIMAIIIIGTVAYAWHKHKITIVPADQISTSAQIKDTAAKDKVSLSTSQSAELEKKLPAAEPDYAIKTTAGKVADIAEQEQQKNRSNWAPIVGNVELSELPKEQPVELKQYHIYTAPKIQREVGLKVDTEHGNYISGISYGIKRRITEKGQYIGGRVDYDWKDKEAAIWVTYSW